MYVNVVKDTDKEHFPQIIVFDGTIVPRIIVYGHSVDVERSFKIDNI